MSHMPSSFFIALRDSPYAPRIIPTHEKGYNSCFHLARNARSVAALYQLGCDLESRDYQPRRDRMTAFTRWLMKCNDWGFLDMSSWLDMCNDVLPMLMRLGATWVNPQGNLIASGNDLMSLVIEYRCHGAVEELLASGRIEALPDSILWDQWMNAAALHSTHNDTIDCLRVLLEYGGNPNTRDEWGRSLLQRLNYRDSNVKGLQLLLGHGADPNERLCAAEDARWTYAAILQYDQETSGAKRPRAIGSVITSGATTRLGFDHRHDDDVGGDDDVREHDSEIHDNLSPNGTHGAAEKSTTKCPGKFRMDCAVFVWLRNCSYRELEVLETFLSSAPTFDLLAISRSGTSLLATVCALGDRELLETYFRVAERCGIAFDVNQRSHQVPLCLLDCSGKVLPSLLQRGLSLDGSFDFTETTEPDWQSNYFSGHECCDATMSARRRYDIPLLPKRRGQAAGEMRLFLAEPTKQGRVAIPREFKAYFIGVQALQQHEPEPAKRWEQNRSKSYSVCIELRGEEYCFDVPKSFFELFHMRRTVRETFVTWALLQHYNREGVLALLKTPAVDVDSPNGRGMYPLHIAAQAHGRYSEPEDNATFLKMFQRCRHVDVVNDEGNNVLHHLAVWGAGDRLGYCLGDSTVTVQADAHDDDKADDVDIEDVRRKQEVLRSLINRPNHAGHTPLTLVLALGYWDLAPLLVRHGADVACLGPAIAKHNSMAPLTLYHRFPRKPVPNVEGEARRCSRCSEPQISDRDCVGIALIDTDRDKIQVCDHHQSDEEDGDEDAVEEDG